MSRALDYRDVELLSRELTATLDPRIILTNLIAPVREVLGAARCSVVRLDPGRHPRHGFVFTAADDPSIEGYRLELSQYPEIEVALEEGRPVLVRDDPSDPVARRIRALYRKVPFPLSVVVPLTYRRETFGVLFLRFDDPNSQITKEQMELCQAIAFGASVALRNAREYEDILADLHVHEDRVRQFQEANALRMEMLAAATHDIRAPLNAIIGYSELLGDGAYGPVTGEQEETFGNIIENSAKILQIVNNLIDHSRLEGGQIPVRKTEGEVTRLLDELRVTIEPLARRRGLELVIEARGSLSALETDWEKLRRILVNLLHNALQYTDEGRITLTTESGDGSLTFRVEDSGPGIAPEELPHIFDRFYRVQPDKAQSPGGLGLSIVKRYCELLGARIEVESQPGQGTSFTVTLPTGSAPFLNLASDAVS